VLTYCRFLPYTIDFHDPSPAERADTAARTLAEVGRSSSTHDLRTKKVSLFDQNVSAAPRTPSAADHQDFFAQVQLSAASHFPKPFNPKALVRSDSNIPEWGSGLLFNQPRPNMEPAPPNTILEYAKAQERLEAQKTKAGHTPSLKDRHCSQNQSGDHRWATDWTVVPAVQGNGGLTNAVRAAVESGELSDVLMVGTIGFPTDVLGEDKKAEIHDKLESEHEALTVYVSDADFKGHYTNYCKTILWPVFHYQIPNHPKSKAYQDHSWVFYVKINQAFADEVVANYKHGDIIWIHDYHLCLVPAMIRMKIPDAQIGFFLHTAFPSSEVFRCLPTRKVLLEGMLGANLVAFQTHEYAHHFKKTCSRLLSVEATDDGVQRENQFVNVWWHPIGIDPNALALAREELEVVKWIKALQKRYAGKRLIVARDKLDSIRGVRQKLLAFELFLNKYPEWKDKVFLTSSYAI
jgi:trehalose 6-phosphate synthase/phosphatase